MLKWIGAILILASCGGFGFSLSAAHAREETALLQVIDALEYMRSELQYRMTPLPELCALAGNQNRSAVGQVLLMLARELECKISPDAEQCMLIALDSEGEMPRRAREAFRMLGTTLGRFDAEGQLRGLESVEGFCRQELRKLSENRDIRLRGYQTLGLCAGAALVILFI